MSLIKPPRTIEQAVADLVAEAVRDQDWLKYNRAIRLERYATSRRVVCR